MEKIITRKIKLGADPVSKEQLIIGNVYFETSFTVYANGLFPVMHTYVLTDIEKTSDEPLYIFEQVGLEYRSVDEKKPLKFSYEALCCFYSFEVALDIFLSFSEEQPQRL